MELRASSYWLANWKKHVGTLAIAIVALVCVQAWQTRAVPSGTIANFEMVLLQANGSATTTTFEQWRAQDWPVLTVAMQSGQAADVANVLQKRQLRWTSAVDTSGSITRLFGFKAVPAFVIVDAGGHIRTPSLGYTSEIGMRLRLWWITV